MNKAPLAIAVTALAIGSLAGVPQALAAAPKAANFELDAAPEPGSAPDPLTPPEAHAAAPAAPAAPGPPSPAAVASPPAEVDPIVVAVRQLLTAEPTHSPSAGGDGAGLVGYYTEASQPIWVEKAGFTARAKRAIEEIGKAEDWG